MVREKEREGFIPREGGGGVGWVKELIGVYKGGGGCTRVVYWMHHSFALQNESLQVLLPNEVENLNKFFYLPLLVTLPLWQHAHKGKKVVIIMA